MTTTTGSGAAEKLGNVPIDIEETPTGFLLPRWGSLISVGAKAGENPC